MDLHQQTEVSVPVGSRTLPGHLAVPPGAAGIVAFAHGSGSSRRSVRNRFVASAMNDAGFATLLLDLLTPPEEADRANVFEIEEMAARLEAASIWLADQPQVGPLPLGYFGASTGAAAALWAASQPGAPVEAIVSRGGRPDLAADRLAMVRAPTLLIVGGQDRAVLALNEDAAERMSCLRNVEVIPGATHLFEEPGALETVAILAAQWYAEHLGRE